MDAVSSLLGGHHARGAFVIRSLLAAPWSIRLEDDAPLTVIAIPRGSAWFLPDGAQPQFLRAGDAVLVRGPGHYTVGDDPGTPRQARIGPGQVCTKPDGSPLSDFHDLGVLTWGNCEVGDPVDTVMLTGTYESAAQVSAQLLAQLPSCLVVRGGEPATAAIVQLLVGELERDDPGQGAVLDRLVDLLTVTLVRAWFAGSAGRAPSWYCAYDDPVAGVALRRLHHEPARPWTVGSLAAEAGVSRAAFARRFADAVGEPPMAYLARWRLDVAADLLRDTDLTVESVARKVGYGSGFSLSTAFSRHRGTSPSAFRKTIRATPAPLPAAIT